MRHRFGLDGPGIALAMLAGALAACVPVTVNVTFPQSQLDMAAQQIEDKVSARAATPTPTPAPTPAPTRSSGSRNVAVTPQISTDSPEVLKAAGARRERRPALRVWKNRGCIGEDNQGMAVPRPGEGCGPEAAALMQAENADRRIIYTAFMKENQIPASDMARVHSAFAKARQEHSRPNDWVQRDDGQWVRKE